MLGDTNITAISENTLVTEIENYGWIAQESGAAGDIVKAIFANNMLVAVTGAGEVIYTNDGEVWEISESNIVESSFADIIWDGEKYVIVGNEGSKGLIVASADLKEFTKIELSNNPYVSTMQANKYEYEATKLFGIIFRNRTYTIFGVSDSKSYFNFLTWSGKELDSLVFKYTNERGGNGYRYANGYIAKNSLGCAAYMKSAFDGTSAISYGDERHSVYITYDMESFNLLVSTMVQDDHAKLLNVFEVKDELYMQYLKSDSNYQLVKISTNGTEVLVMNTGNNFGFVDGVYYNNCQVFFNAHDMLIVKKGESIKDKTVDNLIEITYDSTITCAIKAFDKIYLLGNGGMIMMSSEEEKSNEALAVSTMSARKALADAKSYTDSQVNVVEEQLAALSARMDILERKE